MNMIKLNKTMKNEFSQVLIKKFEKRYEKRYNRYKLKKSDIENESFIVLMVLIDRFRYNKNLKKKSTILSGLDYLLKLKTTPINTSLKQCKNIWKKWDQTKFKFDPR